MGQLFSIVTALRCGELPNFNGDTLTGSGFGLLERLSGGFLVDVFLATVVADLGRDMADDHREGAALQGEGGGPDIACNPASISMGATLVGATRSAVITTTIENTPINTPSRVRLDRNRWAPSEATAMAKLSRTSATSKARLARGRCD